MSAPRFPKYPAYKDSGVKWLGMVPSHWRVVRLKTAASVELSNVDKKSVDGQEPVRLCNYVDVYYNEHITSDIEFMHATATPDQIRRFALRAGDVLITKDSESWTDIAVPAVVREDLPGVLCGYHLAHVRPGPGVVGAFLSRAFAAIGPRDQFRVAANGITRFGLGGDAIRSAAFALPSVAEQRSITAFLDRETAKIDALIAKKEQLIELLHERRAALVTEVVTKGLDPTVPMKDTGVEWLGEVPRHWEVVQLKRAVTFQRGHDLPADSREDGGVPIISSGGVSGLHSRHAAKGPGIVTGRYGTIGQFHLIEQDYWPLNTTLYSIALHGNNPTYLVALLTHLSPFFLLNAVKSAVPGVDRNDIHPIPAVVPPVREQREIAGHVVKFSREIEVLSENVGRAVARLQEYRTALISAAVTGQIDVRGEVA